MEKWKRETLNPAKTYITKRTREQILGAVMLGKKRFWYFSSNRYY